MNRPAVAAGSVSGDMPVLFDPLGELGWRIGAELRTRQLAVGLSLAQRLGRLTGLVQSGHEAERGVGAQRVQFEQPPPPVRRLPVLAPLGGFGR